MAGIAHLKPFQREALAGLVDATIQNAQETVFDQFLPDKNTFNNHFVYDVIKNTPHVAGLIAYGAEAPVADRDSVARIHGEVAKMGIKYIVTEEELLAIHHARLQQEYEQTVQQLVAKTVDLIEAIRFRAYIMKAQAITTGQLVYNANGVKATVDFGIPGTHKIAYSSSIDFSNSANDPIGILISWVQTYETDNMGQSPDTIIMSRQVMNALMQHPKVVALAGSSNTNLTRVSEQFLQDVFRAYGLPPITIVRNTTVYARNPYTGQDEAIQILDPKKIVMVGQGLGNFLWGVTAENNFQPGITVQVYDKQDPVQSIIKAVGAGFPAIAKPSLLFHANVLP